MIGLWFISSTPLHITVYRTSIVNCFITNNNFFSLGRHRECLLWLKPLRLICVPSLLPSLSEHIPACSFTCIPVCVLCLSRGLGRCWLLVNGYLPALCCDRNRSDLCAYQREKMIVTNTRAVDSGGICGDHYWRAVCVSAERLQVLVIDHFNDLHVKSNVCNH